MKPIPAFITTNARASLAFIEYLTALERRLTASEAAAEAMAAQITALQDAIDAL